MSSQDAGQRQLVSFDLAEERYGVDIRTVREIVKMQHVTRTPGAPRYVLGVMHLRGTVIPVVDLGLRLGLGQAQRTSETRVVVVDFEGEGVGVVVDAVHEVLRIPIESVEPPSLVITTVESRYLEGIVNLEGRLIVLLDLTRALESEERARPAGVLALVTV